MISPRRTSEGLSPRRLLARVVVGFGLLLLTVLPANATLLK